MLQTGLIIDCDTGRDDALAIWLALHWKRNLVALVASYGNTILDNVSENCLRVLNFAGRPDIDVFVGAGAPSCTHKGIGAVVGPRQAAAGNGMCNLELPKAGKTPPAPLSAESLAQKIKDLAAKHGKLDYVITGPATNFAAILAALGQTAGDYIARVTMMGGKLDALWEAMPVADFNIVCDPFAVEAILKSGLEARFVTMNTTWPIALPLAEVEQLAPATEQARFSKDLMIAHCRHFATEPTFRFHDPSVIALLDDTAYTPAKITVITDEKSDHFGRMVKDENGYGCHIHALDEARISHVRNDMLAALGFVVGKAA